MAARDAEEALADRVLEGVPDLLRRPKVHQTTGERLDKTVAALGALIRTVRPSELACSWLNLATSVLSLKNVKQKSRVPSFLLLCKQANDKCHEPLGQDTSPENS